MILVFMRTMYAAERERPEKYRPELESDPELCDASSMFHHLSYRANWELAVMWIHDKPMDSGYNYVCDVMNA